MKKIAKKLFANSFYIRIVLVKLKLRELKKHKKIESNKRSFIINEYVKYYGSVPDLESPKSFSEKLLWLKLNYYKKEYADLTDKHLSKEKISNIIGKDISVRTLKTFSSPSKLDFTALPNKFVIKMNNGSGYIFLVERTGKKYRIVNIKEKDKVRYNLRRIKLLFKYLFKIDYYLSSFEWNYKGIVPLIIAEEYIENHGGLVDYKFFVNYGKLICFYAVFGRLEKVHSNYYDDKKNFMNVTAASPPDEFGITLPANIDTMIEYALLIGKNIPLVRVDLYNLNGEIKFGELTFFHQGGHVEYYYPENFNETLGQKINIDDLLKDYERDND